MGGLSKTPVAATSLWVPLGMVATIVVASMTVVRMHYSVANKVDANTTLIRHVDGKVEKVLSRAPWLKDQGYVMKKLEEHDELLKKINENLIEMKIDLGVIKRESTKTHKD